MRSVAVSFNVQRWLFLIFGIHAVATNPVAAQSERHFLWRVVNAPAPVYLLGSMHALRKTDYPLPIAMQSAIAGSRYLVFETNPEAQDAPLLRKKLAAAASYPRGITIQQKIRPSTLALLNRIARISPAEYRDFRPWAIAYFMLEAPALETFKPRLSVDAFIYRQMRGRVEIGGLETNDELVRSFAQMSDAESESFFLQSVAYGERSPELLDETIVAWKAGNCSRMYQLYAPGSGPGGYWRWVERRNAAWIPRIESMIRSGKPTIIVAGALHFCGPRSVIALLRQRGHHVEQM